MLHIRQLLACLIVCLLVCALSPGALAAGTDEDRVNTVAAWFLRDYFTKGYTTYFLESTLVTPAAKAALKRIEAAARKKDPKLGLDHDPVAQGQDHATDYSVENVIVTGDKATADGVAQGFPKIALRLVRNKAGWLIDGAGEINPAPKSPARR